MSLGGFIGGLGSSRDRRTHRTTGVFSGPASRVRACDRAKTSAPLATPSFAHRGVCGKWSHEGPGDPFRGRTRQLGSGRLAKLAPVVPLGVAIISVPCLVSISISGVARLPFQGRPVSIFEVRLGEHRGQRLRETGHPHETRFETNSHSAHGKATRPALPMFSRALTSFLRFANRLAREGRTSLHFHRAKGERYRAVASLRRGLPLARRSGGERGDLILEGAHRAQGLWGRARRPDWGSFWAVRRQGRTRVRRAISPSGLRSNRVFSEGMSHPGFSPRHYYSDVFLDRGVPLSGRAPRVSGPLRGSQPCPSHSHLQARWPLAAEEHRA